MLTFTYLCLENYKRFPLRDSVKFEYHFTSKIYLITGVNGSGKTSFLNELTSLPADKNNFNKGGYKEIHLLYNNSKYKLISDFRSGSSFSFIQDDEELNASNNITTQKDLVYKHFNITDSVHDLLTGQETFTNLSLLARKKLFSTLTNINIDVVLDTYNKLKEELKVNELLLKSQLSVLQAEELKVSNPGHIDSLKSNISVTRNHMELLLQFTQDLHRYKSTDTLDSVYSDYKDIITKLGQIYSKFYSYLVIYPEESVPSIKLNYSNNLSSVNTELNNFYSLLQSKQQELNLTLIAKEADLSELQTKSTTISNQIISLTTTLKYFTDLTIDTNKVRGNIHTLESMLPDILHHIPTNDTKIYSRDKYNLLLTSKKNLIDKLTTLLSRELSTNKELKELSELNDNISCPNCSHTWSPKDIPTLLLKTKTALELLIKEKIDIQSNIKELDILIEQQQTYLSLYEQFMSIRSSTYTVLKPLWTIIDQESYILLNPKAILPLLNHINLELETIDTIVTLNKELQDVTSKITTKGKFKEATQLDIETAIESISLSIEDTASYKHHLESVLYLIPKIEKLYEYIKLLSKASERSLDRLFSVNLHSVSTEILKSVESDLTLFKTNLISLEKELHNYDSIQTIITKQKESIDDTKSTIKVIKYILDELSPKNGILAKVVSSFLNIIITSINKTIQNVWSYKLVLIPIDVDSESLTYRFKLEVEDKLIIDDISKTSKGMQNIINLSFVLILYKLLGLNSYPLFLDELASNMDTEHSEKMLHLVSSIANSDKFSQLFIITHKESYTHINGIEVIQLS